MKQVSRALATFALGGSLLLGPVGCGGGDDGDGGGSIFPEKPECMGADVKALMGDHQMVVSKLNIAKKEEGFDLDGDGKPDNKLAPLSSLARGPLEDAFKDYSLILPLELFDYSQNAADSCVKFAFYLGQVQLDTDGDGEETAKNGGDCDDGDMNAKPGGTEMPGNGKDDDCDGLTDEAGDNTPSMDATDSDQDGVTVAQGDCNDNDAMVKPGGMEICGDGKDNDCKQGADWTDDGTGLSVCTPFDGKGVDTIVLDPQSFLPSGDPQIEFNAAQTVASGADVQLTGGPALFSVTVPIGDLLDLELRITGTTIEAKIADVNGKLGLTGGRLGGVLDGKTLDTVRGLEVDEIGLTPENSLLDAIFTNPTLGVIVNLPKVDTNGDGEPDCSTPDIDVDRDGYEAFCDSNMDGNPDTKIVDTCIDGDGTVYRDGDMGSTHCTEIKDEKGNFLFVDGVSVALTFEAVPAKLEMK
jgi:hypothetical protein